jgi:hypothetical protein
MRAWRSRAVFSAGTSHPTRALMARSDVDQGSVPMTFVNRLSVITAYIALAFVGAIVFGVI